VDLHADERAHFMATMGFEYHVDESGGHGRVVMGEYLRTGPNWPSQAALLTFADVLIGLLASHQTAPRISITTDLSVHMVGEMPVDGELRLGSRLGKVGRSMTVGETEVHCARTGELIAVAIGTFQASPRPQDVADPSFRTMIQRPAPDVVEPTLAAQVGIRVPGPGFAELDMRPDLLNATESLQGGLVALIGEVAAQSAAEASLGKPAVVDSLEVHYLAAARAGPFQARARLLSPDVARVEVRDPGRENRLVSLIIAGTRRLAPE
jgi:acyl-coenzyme A thioesterase PaaI-like protein